MNRTAILKTVADNGGGWKDAAEAASCRIATIADWGWEFEPALAKRIAANGNRRKGKGALDQSEIKRRFSVLKESKTLTDAARTLGMSTSGLHHFVCKYEGAEL